MVSDRTRAHLDALVRQGMEAALAAGEHAAGFEAGVPAPAAHDTRTVMLTVASSAFRMNLLLHFDPAAVADDAMAEQGNLCCGAFNRELGRVFRQVGMSTPSILDRRVVDHLGLLRAAHVAHFRLTLADGRRRHATLCVSSRDPLDFALPAAPQAQQQAAGELELF